MKHLVVMKKVNFILIIGLLLTFACRTNKPLWKGIRHYETNSFDINGDSFLKIVFAIYSDDSTYFFLIQDRIQKINFTTQGKFNDSIEQYMFYPSANYKVTVDLFKKENPIGGINDTLFFRMKPATNTYKRRHIPWNRFGYPFKSTGGRPKRL